MEFNQINNLYDNENFSKEEALKILNGNTDLLTKVEFDFLLGLINSGNLKAFKDNYWGFLKANKEKNIENNDIEFINTDFDNRKYDNLKIKSLASELKRMQRTVADYVTRLSEVEDANRILAVQNKSLEIGFSDKDKLLNESMKKIQHLENINVDLQSKVQQERIDEKIPTYVNNVKSELGSDDTHFIRMSIIWAVAGVIFGLSAVGMSIYTLFLKIDFSNITTSELIYIFTRGIIGILILSWLSFICLGNSKKYTHESIRRKDRRHALMFGQVYLQIYGATASKEDAILVFKDWNMSGDSAFSGQTELPPNLLSIFSNLKEKIKSSSESKETT